MNEYNLYFIYSITSVYRAIIDYCLVSKFILINMTSNDCQNPNYAQNILTITAIVRMKNPSIINLPTTNYNDRYGSEIIRKTLNSSYKLKKQELYWMVNEQTDWSIFTITITFNNAIKSIYNYKINEVAMYEFNYHVLPKIRRKLCRKRKYWDKVLPTPDFVVYERDQGSYFKPVPTSSAPHHIHGLFAVQSSLEAKIFDRTAHTLDPRLTKDLSSVKSVSSFLIEPLRTDEAESWYHYLLKGKTQAELGWN